MTFPDSTFREPARRVLRAAALTCSRDSALRSLAERVGESAGHAGGRSAFPVVAGPVLYCGDKEVNRDKDYVRSLYFLGQISERKGDRAKASEYYRGFVQYWGDGDIDRERVVAAKKQLASSQ
jgi:hypothetical protein